MASGIPRVTHQGLIELQLRQLVEWRREEKGMLAIHLALDISPQILFTMHGLEG